MERVETLGSRLGQLMRERGLNYEALGRLLEMKPQTLNRYVLGQREPKAGVVMEMAARLGVDERWLQGYDVPQVRQSMPGEQMVPVLGAIRAGGPIVAREQIEGWEPADVSDPSAYFYLRVEGDSMINAGIFDGDLVMCEEAQTARNAEMVVALIDDSATVKTYYKEAGYYRLQPENDTMDPIIVQDGELQILGKVIGIFRFLS